MLPKLLEIIGKKVVLSEEDATLCGNYFEEITVAKNTVIEQENRVPKYLYFIGSGYLRLFYRDDSGLEITSHIGTPESFLTSFLSFINGRDAKENIASITDCSLFRISKPDLRALIDQSSAFREFSLLIFEQAIGNTEIRADDLATLNAEQRYRKLLLQQPSILQNVPVQYIASYLGIKPESLSRIRRQIIS